MTHPRGRDFQALRLNLSTILSLLVTEQCVAITDTIITVVPVKKTVFCILNGLGNVSLHKVL